MSFEISRGEYWIQRVHIRVRRGASLRRSASIIALFWKLSFAESLWRVYKRKSLSTPKQFANIFEAVSLIQFYLVDSSQGNYCWKLTNPRVLLIFGMSSPFWSGKRSRYRCSDLCIFFISSCYHVIWYLCNVVANLFRRWNSPGQLLQLSRFHRCRLSKDVCEFRQSLTNESYPFV